jgi:hypothetical protein
VESLERRDMLAIGGGLGFGSSGVNSSTDIGDYDHDGISDPAIYITSEAVFAYIASSGAPSPIVSFGLPRAGQTIPTPADFFGTGQDDIAAYLPSMGAYEIRNPTTGPDVIFPFGIPGQTIPFELDSDFDAGLPGESAFDVQVASVPAPTSTGV